MIVHSYYDLPTSRTQWLLFTRDFNGNLAVESFEKQSQLEDRIAELVQDDPDEDITVMHASLWKLETKVNVSVSLYPSEIK